MSKPKKHKVTIKGDARVYICFERTIEVDEWELADIGENPDQWAEEQMEEHVGMMLMRGEHSDPDCDIDKIEVDGDELWPHPKKSAGGTP